MHIIKENTNENIKIHSYNYRKYTFRIILDYSIKVLMNNSSLQLIPDKVSAFITFAHYSRFFYFNGIFVENFEIFRV